MEIIDSILAILNRNNMALKIGQDVWNLIYPVGSVYISIKATNPSTYFGGTWERIQDRFLLASGSSYSAGSTGGEAKHTLTTNEMPSHDHVGLFVDTTQIRWGTNTGNNAINLQNIPNPFTAGTTTSSSIHTASTGGSQAHNNMPPYIAVYMWKGQLKCIATKYNNY